jgi:hypothetical protein
VTSCARFERSDKTLISTRSGKADLGAEPPAKGAADRSHLNPLERFGAQRHKPTLQSMFPKYSEQTLKK